MIFFLSIIRNRIRYNSVSTKIYCGNPSIQLLLIDVIICNIYWASLVDWQCSQFLPDSSENTGGRADLARVEAHLSTVHPAVQLVNIYKMHKIFEITTVRHHKSKIEFVGYIIFKRKLFINLMLLLILR